MNENKPVQLNPSPVNPVTQVQMKLPGKFVQIANSLQLALFTAHSSMSETYAKDVRNTSCLGMF